MNKVALITGAGSDIGRCCALALLREGYSVVLAGRRLAALNETAAQAGSSASQTLSVQAEVADPPSVASLFQKTASAFGRLDLLFNNAGVNVPQVPMENIKFEQWRSVIDTILTGSFLCTQAAFRLMRSQHPKGGRIINNGSISAHVPRPFSAPYTAAKHAITGLTKSTALDGRIHNIACGQIDIGNASTEMTKKSNRPAAPSTVREAGTAGWQGETTIMANPPNPTTPHSGTESGNPQSTRAERALAAGLLPKARTVLRQPAPVERSAA